MPVVRMEKLLAFPLKKVYASAKETEKLARYIPNLTKIEILEQSPEMVKARWHGKIQIMGMSRDVVWVEVDHWDDSAHLCTFEQVEGTFKIYRGTWAFEEHPEGTKTTLNIEYDLGLPIGGPLLDSMLEKIVRENAQQFLNGLEALVKEVPSQ